MKSPLYALMEMRNPMQPATRTDDRPEFLRRKIQSWSAGKESQLIAPARQREEMQAEPGANACESIYMEFYLERFSKSASAGLRNALGLDQWVWSVDPTAIKRQASVLPIDQQCRLCLLLLLSLPADAASQAEYADILEAHRKEIAVRLSGIDSVTLNAICEKMGYPRARVPLFERTMKKWKAGP